MSGSTDILIKKLADTINSVPIQKTSPYDTQAEVIRIEGSTAWVHIPGGVDETPVQLTTNAKKGDIVQVRVSGGRAWLYGNQTSPPTDDTTAKAAQKTAAAADEHAVSAITSAMLAQEFAEQAKSDAESASTAAGQAWTKAGEAEAAAQIAQETAESVEGIAQQAQEDADSAQVSAQNAYNSASMAISQLSVVENIVGVLDLLSQNGDYAITSDTEPQANKWYFTRSGSGTQADPYIYTVVIPNPSDDPSSLGYYELVGIDQSIQNYVSSHLALTNEGLNLQNGSTRMLLSTTDGMVLYDQNGNQIAQYGNSAIIGDSLGFHIEIDNTEIGFYQASQKVAYINGNKLYITQSVVLQQMDVGTPANDGGLGQWSWKVHEVNGANNLYLKWLG